MAGAPAGRRAHSLGLGPGYYSQELRPAEEGPSADGLGLCARHAQGGAARQRKAGWEEVRSHVQLAGSLSEIHRDQALGPWGKCRKWVLSPVMEG